MDEPVHGILGRGTELAEVESFIGSAPGAPSSLLLEGPAGIGKTTLWHAGVSFARARGHRVLSCRAAESEARLSYAALGDLFDFELPELPALQKRALDAALLRAEVEGAPPDHRAVSIASLRALAASGPVIVAIDDVQWLDVPSARVLAFVVRRLEDVPVRILAALRLGSGGDPLGLGRAGPAPSLHRVPIGPLREDAMTRLLRARIGGDLVHPVLLRLHRISGGNPLFALEIARALTGQGIRPAPGEPLPVPGDLQQLLAARLAALPSSAADGLLVVAAAARPTEDLVVAAAARRDRASAGSSGPKRRASWNAPTAGSGSPTRSWGRPSTPQPPLMPGDACIAAWRTWSSTWRSGLGTSPSRPAAQIPRWHRHWRRPAGTPAVEAPLTPPPSCWNWPGS